MGIEKIQVEVTNCNNISSAKIEISKNSLNIKYAPNGTGKSTLAKAIWISSQKGDFSILQSYGTDEIPTFSSNLQLDNVFVFDEDFVNSIVFRESEVIEKSFDVFIKSPTYDERWENLNKRLHALKIDIGKNEQLLSLLNIFSDISNKIQLKADGEVKSNPFFKSLISKEHIFKIPPTLEKFKHFFQTEYNIDWIDWKNKGYNYDDKGDCPFCTEPLKADYETEKKSFTDSYSKSNAKNLKDILGYFEALEKYMLPEKHQVLNDCIKATSDEILIKTVFRQFITEINYISGKIRDLISFDSYNIKSGEISGLDNKLNELKINKSVLDIFCSEDAIKILDDINLKIDIVLSEIDYLKKEVGELKGVIQASAIHAKDDINKFLESSGINYEMLIEVTSDRDSKTILKYKDRNNNGHEVDKIKQHLSWGERNAFALVLFMHYAISRKASLIVLDDPISSFDSDKKYAIINRLFKNKDSARSFYKETVLMLTHDLEPVIDFVVNNKPAGNSVFACHLLNQNGVISEMEIQEKDMHSQIQLFASIARDEGVNEIHRIVALRKIIEHTERRIEEDCAYNIISSLVHGKTKPDKKIGQTECVNLTDEELSLGITFICSWIPTFSYDKILKNNLTPKSLISAYKAETCNYFKLQLFRILLEIDRARSKIKDDILLKYIDETYHIENDYLYNLDFRKFNIIPAFIIKRSDEFITRIY